MEKIGHRGAKKELPENTVAAFKRAFERGADAIELDVHATRDGVVVVHHDPTLGSGFGGLRGQAIADLEWRALAAAAESLSTRIPMLSEVFAVVPPGGTVYVEIKGAGIESRVAEALSETRVRCAVHSFDHAAIERMRELAPSIPRGILIERRDEDIDAAIQRTRARDVWPAWKLVDRELIERVHGAGARMIAWTVNDAAVARRFAADGIDGVCTDDVRILD